MHVAVAGWIGRHDPPGKPGAREDVQQPPGFVVLCASIARDQPHHRRFVFTVAAHEQMPGRNDQEKAEVALKSTAAAQTA
jgi:hypothetical protein